MKQRTLPKVSGSVRGLSWSNSSIFSESETFEFEVTPRHGRHTGAYHYVYLVHGDYVLSHRYYAQLYVLYHNDSYKNNVNIIILFGPTNDNFRSNLDIP